MRKMKNENSWKLGCGGRISVRETYGFTVTLELDEGNHSDRFHLYKSKATIQAIRRMCNWMEKRL